MTNEEIIDFLAKELVDNYIFGERSDNPCEYYHYKKGDCDTDEDCRTCLIEYLRNKKPTLTEDERTILRKLNKEATVTRYDNKLYFHCEGNLFEDDVFSFIKERRRI